MMAFLLASMSPKIYSKLVVQINLVADGRQDVVVDDVGHIGLEMLDASLASRQDFLLDLLAQALGAARRWRYWSFWIDRRPTVWRP